MPLTIKKNKPAEKAVVEKASTPKAAAPEKLSEVAVAVGGTSLGAAAPYCSVTVKTGYTHKMGDDYAKIECVVTKSCLEADIDATHAELAAFTDQKVNDRVQELISAESSDE